MNKYLNLHLEKIEVPNNYMEIVSEEGEWVYEENEVFCAFDLSICEVTSGISYICDLDPFDDESTDMEKLNNLLENAGYEVNGYGWEEYFCKYIEENYDDFFPKVNTDSESDTCGIYVMDSLEDYKKLLLILSESVRSLLS